jgi:hypothetical protein
LLYSTGHKLRMGVIAEARFNVLIPNILSS